MIYFISGVTLADLCRLINSPGKIYLNRDRIMILGKEISTGSFVDAEKIKKEVI